VSELVRITGNVFCRDQLVTIVVEASDPRLAASAYLIVSAAIEAPNRLMETPK
jgi:hypothetical protein